MYPWISEQNVGKNGGFIAYAIAHAACGFQRGKQGRWGRSNTPGEGRRDSVGPDLCRSSLATIDNFERKK